MKIAKAARTQLEMMLAMAEPGAAVSLLLGFTYDDAMNKVPHVDVAVMSGQTIASMKAEYAEFGDQLFQEIDGFRFAMIISDDDGLLDGRMLDHAEGSFSLRRVTV